MKHFPKSLTDKLELRRSQQSFRQLTTGGPLVDFASNDYLGFAKSDTIFQNAHQLLVDTAIHENGATGSRLLTGNHTLYNAAEKLIAEFHDSASALIFNSGYDANVGFVSAVPQRSDVILYDELCHASIRDGIRLGTAKSFKFRHNDLEHLTELIIKHQAIGDIYIITESVFSMDGDTPDLAQLVAIANAHNCFVIIDEAHALGVFGNRGQGLVEQLGLQHSVFARIVTFGKGLGCHGAAVLGASQLRDYLINFARSFIYTTGLPPHSIATIISAYNLLVADQSANRQLVDNILHFNQHKKNSGLSQVFVRSKSAIQSAIIPGNEKVKGVAFDLQQRGFDVKAILSPTVPEGQERLRICLHSYNTPQQINGVLDALAENIF